MSVTRRWVLGSLANWARIGIGTLVQLASVPIFLTYWTPAEYGVWLVISSLTPYLTAIDMGHQNYLAYEFIKAKDNEKLARLFTSSLAAGLVMGVLAIFVTACLVWTGAISGLLGRADATLASQAGLVLILQSIAWLITGSCGGLLGRAIVRLGHYPRTAWWGVIVAIVTGVAPLIGVALHGDVLSAGLWLVGATLLINIPLLIDFMRVWLRDASFPAPDLKLALRNALMSLGVTGRDFLNQLRQQGIRLILAPVVGVAQMTAFSTTRTGANVALQGLNSIMGPFEPELLGFLRNRDQLRVETALSVTWALVVYLIGPGLVAAQLAMPLLFETWTRGRIALDPLLFAILSASVAVFAYAQTATTVVRGNNMVRVQLIVSIVTAAATLLGLYLMVKPLGLRGAGLALLLAEICSCVIYQAIAADWMNKNDLKWPSTLARAAALGTLSSIGVILLAGWLPQHAIAITLAFLLVHATVSIAFYLAMPLMARDRINKPFGRIASAFGGAR
jgi:O-antigen/teichoic acid export membrane protein